ncbi:cell division protein ZapB [Bacillus thuringiensis]|uniref:cell division protein ZapB n=1 Tax=Bacillus thuringiensis TaxID=1428 RepID=UPI00301977B0
MPDTTKSVPKDTVVPPPTTPPVTDNNSQVTPSVQASTVNDAQISKFVESVDKLVGENQKLTEENKKLAEGSQKVLEGNQKLVEQNGQLIQKVDALTTSNKSLLDKLDVEPTDVNVNDSIVKLTTTVENSGKDFQVFYKDYMDLTIFSIGLIIALVFGKILQERIFR